MGKKIVALDLDGTLVAGNTLHLYIKCGLKHSSFYKKMQICGWLALRALRIVSHPTMKFAILNIIKPDESMHNDFTGMVNERLRTSVKSMISDFHRKGCIVVLATAAPDIYVPWIWDGPYVATPVANNTEHVECRGLQKLNAIRTLMGEDDILECVITDHIDDLPMLNAGAKENILVAPDKHTLATIKMSGIPFKLIEQRNE